MNVDAPRCFECNEVVDGFTATDAGKNTPSPGAVSVCVYCGAIAIFTGHGTERRQCTPEERADLDVHPQIIEARRKCAQVREFLRTGVTVLEKVTLPCGCVLTQALVDAEKTLLVEACSETCSNLANVVTEARKQGKLTGYEERGGTAAGWLAAQRKGRAS